MRIVVTGGAGFIGSSLIRHLINSSDHHIINIDKLTYAGNLESLEEASSSSRYHFEKIDICNKKDLESVIFHHKPSHIMHLAAESHVDRSIKRSNEFIQTNIIGTYNLLETAKKYWDKLDEINQKSFRFHHISTDEVFGDLSDTSEFFHEDTPYNPSSPYSASKASSDHLVRAWYRTYNLPILISNCSNNYGPFQYPEKLIPLMINNAIRGKKLPIYGNGNQIRDWLYVEDHVKALIAILFKGNIGETYNIGGDSEITNLDVVKSICMILDEIRPLQEGSYCEQIEFVDDRPGHDKRYAIDASKIKNKLNWVPQETFNTGLRKTINWYLKNQNWLNVIENKKVDIV